MVSKQQQARLFVLMISLMVIATALAACTSPHR